MARARWNRRETPCGNSAYSVPMPEVRTAHSHRQSGGSGDSARRVGLSLSAPGDRSADQARRDAVLQARSYEGKPVYPCRINVDVVYGEVPSGAG